jgi:hypothetical protein
LPRKTAVFVARDHPGYTSPKDTKTR